MIGGGGERVTLRIVAEHADMWHGFGDPATMKRKTAILDNWCAKVGRDPAEIRRSTTIARLTGDHQDPEAFVELGFSDFVVSVQGPDWDLAPLDRALAWRDSLG
jgi:alkanesulfonate monooxygenase SsuD/methylene tetrahydromethanopterin reductase-like flavin-dependent oxidoreductase (luciferase family)